MVSTNIKTGVDKLVELVSEKKKVTVDAAAKELGVGKDVVQEWAEFLEEENIVSLEYNLSKTWIVEKRITKDDVLHGASEVSSEKEALSRRIDVAITSLQKETSGFEDVRKEFANIQGHIKSEIETVKKQLGDLERYDSLRKNLDKDVSKQRENYDAFIKLTEEKLKIESDKYDDLKTHIEKERKNIEQYIQKMEELKKLKIDYERTINTLKESLGHIEDVLQDYRKRFEESGRVMNNYKSSLDKLEQDISERKGGLLANKMKDLKTDEEKLFKRQAEIEGEIKKATVSMESFMGINTKVHKSFDGYFSKNIATEKLISEIENDKTDLTKDLESLKSKVLAFTLITSNSGIKSQLKEMEEKLKGFERKKLSLRYKIERLISMIKGET
jgi:chromosome segregation ATPase